MKTGRLSKTEKQFIEQFFEEKGVDEVSRILDRNTDSILKYYLSLNRPVKESVSSTEELPENTFKIKEKTSKENKAYIPGSMNNTFVGTTASKDQREKDAVLYQAEPIPRSRPAQEVNWFRCRECNKKFFSIGVNKNVCEECDYATKK